ncbi:hypothetical protein B0H11DRAFT_1938222 [Mycena galericulata]|nr:hypothetical protein B0H11DRAFT_1938222 [Mycena galericulata]
MSHPHFTQFPKAETMPELHMDPSFAPRLSSRCDFQLYHSADTMLGGYRPIPWPSFRQLDAVGEVPSGSNMLGRKTTRPTLVLYRERLFVNFSSAEIRSGLVPSSPEALEVGVFDPSENENTKNVAHTAHRWFDFPISH